MPITFMQKNQKNLGLTTVLKYCNKIVQRFVHSICLSWKIKFLRMAKKHASYNLAVLFCLEYAK